VREDLAVFRRVLDIVAGGPRELLLTPGHCVNSAEGFQTKKSAERLHLWEPIFQFWMRGRKLGFSETGPLVSLLNKLHAAMGIPPPNPNAVRQAIRDFQQLIRALPGSLDS
jgi:hypothetical protein